MASLVLFALQVNIERMPHGLFRRLTGDWRLLGAFAAAFMIAIAVTYHSTVVSSNWLSISVLSITWALMVILALFLYAYIRALSLINPMHQLQILRADTQRALKTWDRRSNRIISLLKPADDIEQLGFDALRYKFFQENPNWSAELKRALVHSMSFSVRYAEQGDHEVSGAALRTVLALNAAYIKTKGNTFFTSNPFITSPWSSDAFINDTLEHVRRNVQTAIGRKDEQNLQQCFKTMADLVYLYLSIPYPGRISDKHHASIAARCLFESVTAVAPHNMTDVILGGLRQMGEAASYIIHYGDPTKSIPIIDKVAVLATVHLAREESRPVAIEAMGLFSRLTIELMRCQRRDVRFSFRQLRINITLLVENVLRLPEPQWSFTHSNLLGSYFSSNDVQSLHSQLPGLVNAIAEVDAEHENAKLWLDHIGQWMDESFIAHRQLFEQAMAVQSSFAAPLIHWITDVAEMLLALSNAPACEDYLKDALRRNARLMMGTLTLISDDEDSVHFGEIQSLTETFYYFIVAAYGRRCDDIGEDVSGYLLSWTFKAGKHGTGWNTLSLGLCALAAISVYSGEAKCEQLKEDIMARLRDGAAPSEELRQQTAQKLKAVADRPFDLNSASSHINTGVVNANHELLQPLLRDIADLLRA